jgi:hypothetical protein
MMLLQIEREVFDRQFAKAGFAIRHTLAEHALFRLPRLIELARSLPADRVEYNAGTLALNQDPTQTPRNGLSVEATIQRIEECNSWMVLKNVEGVPEYDALLKECLGELAATGHPATRPMTGREAFVFISSPGSVTPYHMDPELNFLLQIRGTKTMTVFPADDRSLLSEVELERFYGGAHRNLVYKDDYVAKGHAFVMQPGDGVHVPVTAPHHVRNGPEVSISFSITFRTPETDRRQIVYEVNHDLRQRGWHPTPYGKSWLNDTWKATSRRVLRRLRRLVGMKEPAGTGY